MTLAHSRGLMYDRRMVETTKIIADHYLVDKLPSDLRAGIQAGVWVRVTVEVPANGRESPARRSLGSCLGTGKGVYSPAEAVRFIRTLRDE
jgi:hypothetical protein